MNLVQRLRGNITRIAAASVLAASAACGGDGGGGTGPTPDDTAPAVSFTGPSGATNNPISLRGTITEPESNASYTLKLNGTTVRSGSEGAFALDTTLNTGAYTAVVHATSEGGATDKSLSFNVSPAPVPPALNTLTVLAPQSVALQGDTLGLSANASNAETTTLDVSATAIDPDYSANGNNVSGTYVANSGFTLTGRAKKTGFSDAIKTQAVTVNPLAGTLGASKTNPTAGEQIQFNIGSLPAGVDSAVVRVDGTRVGALTANGSLPYTPATSGTKQAVLTEYNAAATHSESPLTLNVQPAAQSYPLTIQLVDMDRNPVTQQHTMIIDGTNYVSNASGVINATLLEGVHTISYARRNAADTTATRLELPANYQNQTRIIFPRFKINQSATAGQDTLTINSATNATAEIAGLGANFNKEHHAGYFDDTLYGQQGPLGSTVRFHILKQPNAQYPLCQVMAQGALDTWRQFQQNATTDLASNYSVINTEGDVLPQTMPSGEQVILCQGPIVGNETFRETNGAEKISVAYIFSSSPIAAANTEALLAPYGSSGIEGKCVVPSVFNDPNPTDPNCAIGSATPTAYDHREGLDMMKDFAIPANNRAVNTNTTINGNTKIFFSLRP